MDNNYYLVLQVHGFKFCCKPDAIIIMPLNIGDNYIKQTKQNKTKTNNNISSCQVIQLVFNSCTSLPGHLRTDNPLCPVDSC